MKEELATLEIKESKLSDAGTYKIVATNAIGQIESSCQVTVHCEYLRQNHYQPCGLDQAIFNSQNKHNDSEVLQLRICRVYHRNLCCSAIGKSNCKVLKLI